MYVYLVDGTVIKAIFIYQEEMDDELLIEFVGIPSLIEYSRGSIVENAVIYSVGDRTCMRLQVKIHQIIVIRSTIKKTLDEILNEEGCTACDAGDCEDHGCPTCGGHNICS